MLIRSHLTVAVSASCLCLQASIAPAFATPITLTGNYLQVGISDYGTFGSDGSTEPGLLHDPAGTKNFYPGGIANDYLTPGSPHDGFAINSTETGFVNNDNNGVSGFGMASPTLLTGAAAKGYDNAATWTATLGSSLTVTNSYYFNNGDEQIKVVTLITALTNLTDVALGRSEDPDPDVNRYGSYSTINTRGDAVTAPQDLVSGAGQSTGLTIGILNDSANTYVHNTEISSNCCSNDDPNNVLANAATTDTYPNTSIGDYGLQIAWLLGNMTAGQTDEVDYSYVFGTHQGTVSVPVTSTSTVINTTDGDVSPSVFSLSSGAAMAGTVQFDGGTLQMSGGAFPNNIITAPVTIDTNNGSIDTSTGNGGFSGVVSGPGSLTINGGGSFALLGANTYAGGTTVNGSSVIVATNASLGTGALALNSGTLQAGADGLNIANATGLAGIATIDTQAYGLTLSGVISGSGQLTKVGTGTLALTGANTYTGGTALNVGTVAIGNNASLGTGALTFNSGTLQVLQGSILALGNAVQVTAGGGTIDQNQGGLTLSGPIAGPGALTFVNGGGTPITDNINANNAFDLTSTNSYTGGSTVRYAAAVIVDATNALGTGALQIDAGGIVNLNGVSQTLTTLNGAGTIFAAGGNNAAGSVTLSTLTVQNGTFSGDIDSGHHTTDGVANYGDITLVKVSDGTASGGTLTLNGNSGYGSRGGMTLLQGGTIAVGNNGALGTSSLTMSDGTTLQLGADGISIANAITLAGAGTFDTQDYANGLGLTGVVSGTGSLVKIGSTGLGLYNANTYSGGTLVEGGRITLHNSAGFGTGAVTFLSGNLRAGIDGLVVGNAAVLAGNATFDTQSFGLTYAGAISGAGQLTKIGSGTLTLSNANSYAGGTGLNEGTVAIGNATALGTGVAYFNGGTLQAGVDGLIVGNAVAMLGNGTVDTQAYSLALTGPVSGAGALTKIGTGTLALTGANLYAGGTTLSGGTLAVGNDNALGSGTLQMAAGTTLQFLSGNYRLANAIVFTGVAADPTIDTGSGVQTLSGVISGADALTKIGSGTLDLTGTDTYTGATTVAAGTLLVDGSIASSAVTVNSGATLGGGGAIGGLTVSNGATIAPGVRTLTINGNLSLVAGSTYQATINGDGTSSRLAVTGTASLGGANLALLAGTGSFGAGGSSTLLTAAGGVSGTFGAVAPDMTLALLNPVLTYGANSVSVSLGDPATAFARIASTPNQAATAGAIAALGPNSSLFDTVLSDSASGARQAFNAASGVTHGNTERIETRTSQMLTGVVLDRLWDMGGSGLSARQVVDQFGNDRLPATVRCYGPVPDPVPGLAPQTYTAWGEGFGTFGHSDAGPNAGALDTSLGGFILGIDTPLNKLGFDNWRVGIAGGYTDTTFTSHLDGGTGTVQSVFGSLYGGARYGNIDIRLGATVSGQQTDAQRLVAFPGFIEQEKSSNGGMTVQGFGEIGYRYQVSRFVIEPIAGAAILHVEQDGFRERGGAAALAVAGQDNDLGTTTLGFRGEVAPFNGVPLVAHAFVGWQHLIGNVSPGTTLAFEAAGQNPFTVSGTPLDRDALVTEVALDYRVSAALDMGLSYAGTVGSIAVDHSIKGRVEYKF